MGRVRKDYVQIAEDYCRSVADGTVPACGFIREACERQLRDLSGCFGWHFDHDRAAGVCYFIEHLHHIKGRQWLDQTIRLEPWQVFILTTVFGWVNADGLRRFRLAYIEVARKNAKSTLSAGVGLYCTCADGEPGAEVRSAATTRDQAKIVFDTAKAMVERAGSDMRETLGVDTSAHAVYVQDNLSSFKALSRDQRGNLDGLNLHCGIIDELHAHKTRDVFDVLETATGARAQPLLWLITTAGFNRAGICYEQRDYIRKVLAGSVSDDRVFGAIYTLDEGDDWTDESLWVKANPNLGVSVSLEDLRAKLTKAEATPAAQNNFLTKHLDVWCNADAAWMRPQAWDACADTALSRDDFAGERCWLGLDLASKTDIAALAQVFERDGTFYGFVDNYLPGSAVEDGRNSQYTGWARTGALTVTDGEVTDLNAVQDRIRELSSRFQVCEVAYDPFQATKLACELMDEGFPMVEYRPTVLNFSEPMKELEALVLSHRFVHTGCPALAWQVSNVVCHVDAKDNIFPRKAFADNKIDAVVALITALARALAANDETSVYRSRGLLVL